MSGGDWQCNPYAKTLGQIISANHRLSSGVKLKLNELRGFIVICSNIYLH